MSYTVVSNVRRLKFKNKKIYPIPIYSIVIKIAVNIV